MGLFNELGGILNDITGVSSSARQQAGAQQALQTDAQNFTKWQMSNAHQLEVKDMKDAGINPILSAGGSGAGGTPSMGGASAGVPTDPIGMITSIIQTMNNSAKTDAEIESINTNTKLAPGLATAEMLLKGAQAGNAKAQQAYTEFMKEIDAHLKKAQAHHETQSGNREQNIQKGEQTREWLGMFLRFFGDIAKSGK